MTAVSRFLFALALACAAAAAAAEVSWTLVKDERGIQVFRRPVDGSTLHAIRGVARVSAGMDALVSLLRDYGARPEWDRYCGETFVLRKLGEREDLVYLHERLPWPVKDRDMLLRVQWMDDPATGVVRMLATATTGVMPARPDRVRVTKADVSWTLTPLGDGQVEIASESHVEPGGPLPAWIVNALTVDGPYEALLRIRTIVDGAGA